MRAVVQRVKHAAVHVQGEQIAAIGQGILVLLGIAEDDTASDMRYLCEKCIHLRIFEDEHEIMNQSVAEINGEVLLVSQFTLYGDVRKGRRPSYIRAAKPEEARTLFDEFVQMFRSLYARVETGQFQATMDVSLVNDGPVTILLDSRKEF